MHAKVQSVSKILILGKFGISSSLGHGFGQSTVSVRPTAMDREMWQIGGSYSYLAISVIGEIRLWSLPLNLLLFAVNKSAAE